MLAYQVNKKNASDFCKRDHSYFLRKGEKYFIEIVFISLVLLSLRNFDRQKSLPTYLFAKVYMVLINLQ
jgi:hypothetical protein